MVLPSAPIDASPLRPAPSGEADREPGVGAAEPRGWGRWLLGGAIALGGALRLWLALHDDGIYWPDEVYQSLEPAHRLVFGYGLVAWEFIEGARSWALPGLVAFLLKLCALVGLSEPRQYLTVVKGAFALGALGAVGGTYLLARAYHASKEAAAVGAALFALCAPAIYFAPRAMSETACAVPAVLGLALGLSERGEGRRRAVWAGLLLGLSVLLRLQSAVFCVGLLAILLSRKRWREALAAGASLGVMALVFGWLDHLTWANVPGAVFGGWFHSAVKYVQFNLIEGKASGWGVAPWDFYLRHLFLSMPGVALVAAMLACLAFPKARGLFLLTTAFLVLHSRVPHKELRFLYPLLPLWFALAGIGLSALPGWLFRGAAAVAISCALGSAARFHTLTFGDLGQYPDRPQASAYDDGGPVNRMLLAAHAQPDLCGLRVDLAALAWTGGHSTLHRRVPLYHLGRPPLSSGLFNYLITYASPGLPGVVVAQDAQNPAVVLVRVGSDGCRPDDGYSWRLP